MQRDIKTTCTKKNYLEISGEGKTKGTILWKLKAEILTPELLVT